MITSTCFEVTKANENHLVFDCTSQSSVESHGAKRFLMKRLTEMLQQGNVRLNLTAAGHTHAGRMLFNFYYSTSGNELLELAPNVYGYPHNGGEHTMRISGPADDVFAWFELVRERYAKLKNVQSWFEDIQQEIDADKQEHEHATA